MRDSSRFRARLFVHCNSLLLSLAGVLAASGSLALAGDPEPPAPGGPGNPPLFLPVGTPVTGDNASTSDQFGWSVAIGGDTAVVGAWLEDNERGHSAGSVYVYHWDGLQWTQSAKLTAPDGADEDRFGQAVAVHADLIVVGAYLADVGAVPDAGAAYVFRRSGHDWTFESKLVATDAFRTDHFGRDVALSDSGVAIGAPREERQGGLDQGAVYMYERTGGVWSQKAKLIAQTPGSGDWFGFRIAMSGTTLAVGSQSNDAPGGLFDAGAVDVFRYDGSEWRHAQVIRAADASLGANFGSGVALSGNTLVVGAERDLVAGVRTGSAYIFARDGAGVWRQATKLISTQPSGEDFFGSSVGISGSTIVVAAEKADLGGVIDSGSVQQFEYSAPAHEWVAREVFGSGLRQGNEFFGTDVAFADGLLLVSAPFVDLPDVLDAGAAFVYAQDYDCNADGLRDALQIAAGKLNDVNGNGVPDTCECIADWDRSGTPSSSDVTAFVNDWFLDQASGALGTDIDGNGISNTGDVSSFINAYFEGCI